MNSRQHETRQHGVGRTISLRFWPTICIIVLVALVCVVGLGPGCKVSPASTEGPTPSTQATRQEALTESDSITVDSVTSQLCLPPTERRHFDLSRLWRPDEEKTMTGQQRLDSRLGYLKEEMGNPTTPFISMGGQLDSAYVQAQIIQDMGRTVTAPHIAKARAKETDPALRDRLTLALGLAGDESVMPQLIEMLGDHPEGYLRKCAAEALRHFKDSSAKRALQHALRDRFSVVSIAGVGRKGIHKAYPVREKAAESLRIFFDEPVSPDIYEDKRRARSVAEAITWLFEEKEPRVCVTAVTLLGQERAGIGDLEKFAKDNRSDPNLRVSVALAREIIRLASEGAISFRD